MNIVKPTKNNYVSFIQKFQVKSAIPTGFNKKLKNINYKLGINNKCSKFCFTLHLAVFSNL